MAHKAIILLADRLGADLLPDAGQWTNRFAIRSETSSRKYNIAQNIKTSDWGCSCMGWKSHRHCKHLRALQPYLNQVGRVT